MLDTPTPSDYIRASEKLGPLTFEQRLDVALAELREMLITKNLAYGNSALDPVRIFSDADPVEQLKVRIDDKLSRFSRGRHDGRDLEDVPGDFVGYFVLLLIAQQLERDPAQPCAARLGGDP